MPAFRTALASLAFACWTSASALADPQLADFSYPYPVQTYQFRSQGQPLSMAYMDVQPDAAQRQDHRPPARQELLRRHLGGAPSARCAMPAIA